jgi:muconolactone delta-isomerase
VSTQIVKKSELVELVRRGLVHESFEHSHIGVFDITVMRDFHALLAPMGVIKPINTPLAPLCDHIRAARDFEPARIDELSAYSWNADPGIIVLLPSGESVIIDGTHRALRREREGLKTMRFYSWPLAIADQVGRPDTSKFGDIPGVEWGTPGFLDDVRKMQGENHE